MPFHVRLILLLAALGTKIIELSDKLKQHECKRITKRHLRREAARNKINKREERIRFKSFIRAQGARNQLEVQSTLDDELYTLLKGEA